MTIHLDTSFLIRALVPGSAEDGHLRHWLASRQKIGISAVAWAEFLCGPLDDDARKAARVLLGAPVMIDEHTAELAAAMFNIGGRRRRTFVDCLVAAAAVRVDAQLATSNPTDFRSLESAGLQLVKVAST